MSVTLTKSSNVWTNEEFLAGSCSHLDIGQSKASSSPQAEPQEELTLKELRARAIALALRSPSFFEDDPSFHRKFLLAIAKSVDNPGTEAQINVNISWLNPDRLSYRGSQSGPSDPMDVEPRALPLLDQAKEPVSPPTMPDGSWKEKSEPVTGVNSLIHSLKDSK